jgi:hypothetical protein
MRIASHDASVTLRPQDFQFSPQTWTDQWDQWLMISGHVQHHGRAWSFSDPSLLIPEARELGSWLGAVADGTIQSRPLRDSAGEDDEPRLGFTEPNLAFDFGVGEESGLLLRCYFTLESAPPWLDHDDRLPPWGYVVDLQVDSAQLRRAADDWKAELAALLDRLPPGRDPKRAP